MKITRYTIFFLIVMISITIVVASQFRQYPTHMIVKQVNCLSCHIDEFNDLKEGTHIRMMNNAQNRTLYDYLYLYENSSPNTYKLLEGPCYSCHITYKNFYYFGLTDPYAYSIGKQTYEVDNLTKEIDIINAQYGYIIEWPAGNNSVEYYNNGTNVSISVELEVISISPANFSIDSTIKIIMANYSGAQYDTSCDCTQTLYEGETQVIEVQNIYEDYFKVILILDGLWNNTLVNVRINGTDKGTESFFVIASYHPFIYELPFSETGLYYFKTNGTYKAIRLDYVWAEWQNYTMADIASSEIIETSTSNGWINASTCSAPDAMCHINQKTTYMGLTDGLNPEKRLYTHTMDFVTSRQCTLCHLKNSILVR